MEVNLANSTNGRTYRMISVSNKNGAFFAAPSTSTFAGIVKT